MSNPGMEGFKKQLEELKRKGADIDPDAIIADMTTPPAVHQVDEFKESFDAHAWGLMREKINKLLDDFENHYGPKGRGLSVAIYVEKENSADKFSEVFTYIPDKLSIVHIVDIGQKGVTDKFDPVKEREWVEAHNKMIEEQKRLVAEKEERLKEKE